MKKAAGQKLASWILKADDLASLFDALHAQHYEIHGPTVRDRAIHYDVIERAADLPMGWTDEQDGGVYRLKRRKDSAFFGYAGGQDSWKQVLFPPALRLWRAERGDGDPTLVAEPGFDGKRALLGAHACDLSAIAIQDRVFLEGPYVDPTYRQRRANLFVVAVNCTEPRGTCFCASMQTGPACRAGFDLVLTELADSTPHRFVVTAGSPAGRTLLKKLPVTPAAPRDEAAAACKVAHAARNMGRRLDTRGIKDLLQHNLEHPRWDEVAARCLTCGNCTLVCPTCFCMNVEDTTDVTGQHAERWRKWDSCFSLEFSHIFGGSIRHSSKARYRQWMTHKLAHWIDQFGVSGCVGCGRCITWCPVGIDITEESAAIRATTADHRGKRGGGP